MSEDDSTLDGNCDARRKSLSDSVAGKDEVAVLMRYEGRQTVDNLNSGLTDIDAKASKLMRMNIIVAGLLLSALSFAAKSANVGVEPFINSFSISGLVVLVTSIVAAGSTYSAAGSRVGISAETIQKFVTSDLEQTEVDRGLAKAYARWIDTNRRANVKNAFYLSVTILFVLASVVLFSVGASVGIAGGSLPTHLRFSIWILTIVTIACIGWITDVRRDTKLGRNTVERIGNGSKRE